MEEGSFRTLLFFRYGGLFVAGADLLSESLRLPGVRRVGRYSPRLFLGIVLPLVLLAALPDSATANSDSSGTAAKEPQEVKAASANNPASPKFDILEYRVLGNSALPAPDIERAVYAFLGKEKTLADVEAARLALETKYHERGFGTVFVDIPEQSVNEGIVRLRVTEGKLARVSVGGAHYFSERQIRDALPEASVGTVPNLPVLQSELSQANALTGDRAVTPILKAGAAPGAVDLTLRVDDHLPFHGSLELNNQYTTDTSPLRAIGTMSYDNLFGRADSFSLQYQISPQDTSQVKVLVANLLMHIADERLAFYFLHSDSAVAALNTSTTTGGAVESTELGIFGRGYAYGARLILGVENTAETTQNVTLSAEYKDFLQAINPLSNPDPNNPSAPLDTPVRYINLSADYGGFWRGARLQQSFDTSVNFGLRNLASSVSEFENKRFEGHPNYFYVRSSYSIGAHLPADFTILVRLSGQVAVEPLISNEQFSIAGADGVRGYLEAEELADKALKGTVQLGSPRWKFWKGSDYAEIFVFYDGGVIETIDPLPQEPASATLRSWGSGLNLSFFDHLTGSLTWAKALTEGSITHRGDSRFLFSVRGTW